MNKIKFSPRIEKTLVVAGCSHTQGTAYFKSIIHPEVKKGKTTYEFASQQLKDKYKRDRFTTEWLSKKLTWGGKLAELLEIDRLLNFAFGGMGIDAICRAIYNYGVREITFRNHLFVIQIPSTDRKEILFLEGKKWIRSTAKDLAIQGEGDEWGFTEGDPQKKIFATKYYDVNLYEIEGYTQLLHLQDYINSKGGQVRFITKPFNDIITDKKSQEEKWKKSLEDFNGISFHKEHTNSFNFTDILKNLNIIDTEKLEEYRKKYFNKKEANWTLHTDKTLIGDHHYNESGNTCLAACIYDNLDNKFNPKPLQNVEIIKDKEVMGKSLF
tara:strand:+ start:346 stop:1323 length:978 start_codon:yes stop_codon:yes gene_type:complete